MFESVSFNVFEENLEEIVYGERKTESKFQVEIKSVENSRSSKTEIIIQPLVPYRFNWEREGTSLVL